MKIPVFLIVSFNCLIYIWFCGKDNSFVLNFKKKYETIFCIPEKFIHKCPTPAKFLTNLSVTV
jgi:hypothetical protein